MKKAAIILECMIIFLAIFILLNIIFEKTETKPDRLTPRTIDKTVSESAVSEVPDDRPTGNGTMTECFIEGADGIIRNHMNIDISKIENTDKQDYVGDWYFDYDIGYLLADEVGVDREGVHFTVRVNVEIDDKGGLYAYADKDSVDDGIEDFVTNNMDAIYAFADMYGISSSQADMAVNFLYGGDWALFIKDNFGELIEEEVGESTMTLNYEADGDRMYLWKDNAQKDEENYTEYSVSGEKMTLTVLSKEFEEMMPGITAPLVLYKTNGL